MYRLLRPIFFQFEPEEAHEKAMEKLAQITANRFLRKGLLGYCKPYFRQPVAAFGLLFNHQVGLAAGFDKNAKYLRELECLGFSHIEIGTVTPQPQEGNPKPRLFRLPEDEALLNRMGFNNDGVDAIVSRLEKYKNERKSPFEGALPMLIGGNIGKNKVTANEYAYMDYDICFRKLHPYVDYFVVNVSSPNTPGLRELQEKESLRQILTHLQAINRELMAPKPILLKVAPDLEEGQVDDIAELALEIKLDGFVASNTTLSRENLTDAGLIRIGEAGNEGGISGKPIRERSTQMVKWLFAKTQGKIPIVASGGVFTAAHAKEKLDAGALLLQVYSGFIYQGPDIVNQITKELNG